MNKLLEKQSTSNFLMSKNLQGALWKMLSFAAFAGINGIVRYLSGGASHGPEHALPTHVIMFFQNVFGTLFLLPFVWKSGFQSLKTSYPTLHFIRVTTAVLGISLWYLSLKYMPIAEGVALSFTGPIFTVIGASFLLNEKITPPRFMAIALSLLGAFIISRPDIALTGDSTTLGFAAILPLTSALALAWNKILTRKMARLGESAETLAIYLLLLMVPVSFIPASFEWVFPTLHHWPWILLLGFLASVAHFSFGKAYALAEVTFLTPFGFTKFLFSAFIGYYFFSEIPSSALWIGLAVIGAGILLLSYKFPYYKRLEKPL